jgi:hypothetical protein
VIAARAVPALQPSARAASPSPASIAKVIKLAANEARAAGRPIDMPPWFSVSNRHAPQRIEMVCPPDWMLRM